MVRTTLTNRLRLVPPERSEVAAGRTHCSWCWALIRPGDVAHFIGGVRVCESCGSFDDFAA